ncbi:Elongator complex protein 4 [Orchesella cincta]|uniref:Elongator complex protein 4 n=1 Tax=Orchesella cincta TaxID=48709 RepID=A0A1D2N4I4_ORCCI|nr:Elongator complex protein 4 [Orchesella cincta]
MKSNPIIIKKSSGPILSGRGSRVAIPGVFPSSSRFGEQVVKLRVPSLDQYIGGGIPIGSICIIRDEFPSKFGDMILKSFVADGATYNHRLYIASRHVTPETFSKDLPSVRKTSSDASAMKSMDDEDDSMTDLKIAWRYGQPAGSRPQKASDQSLPAFDFSKKSSVEELGGKNLVLSQVCDDTNICKLKNFSGNDILKEILGVVNQLELNDQSKAPSNVARIAISHCEEQILSDNFMLKLRSIVQHTSSCAVIIISDAAAPPKTHATAITRAEHLADIVLNLQTIVDQKRRNDLGGIDGVCYITKAASNNTLKPFEPPKDIGFSFKKRRLLFHELHLPPEGETTTQREVSSSAKLSSAALLPSSSSSCGSTIKGKSIDF